MSNGWPKVLIPMIKNVMPILVADKIMGKPPSKRLTYEQLDGGWEKTTPPGHVTIMTNVEIAHWIEQQPIHMWKYIDLETDSKHYALNTHFIVSEQLLTWLQLRWAD